MSGRVIGLSTVCGMAERTQRTGDKSTGAPEETAESPSVGTSRRIIDDIDTLLDEIDEVLDKNAEEFVKNYVQKGGE